MTLTPSKMTLGSGVPFILDGFDADEAISSKAIVWQDVRLRKHADYQRVYRATRKQFSASMTWFLASRSSFGSTEPLASDLRPGKQKTATISHTGPRVGLTVGKVIGKAHERNRIKRRLREIVRQHCQELPRDADLILHPRRSVMNMDFVKLEAEVLRIFRQAKAESETRMKNPARFAESRRSLSPAAS